MINLNGLRILNTRPQGQHQMLSDAIQKAGGIAINCPTLIIEPCPNQWLKSLPDLSKIHYAIFISVNAVNYFFNQLKAASLPWSSHIEVIAVGEATAHALHQQKIVVNFIPHVADSEHLLEHTMFFNLHGKLILLVKGEGGRPLIAETLIHRGAELITVNTYRRSLPSLEQDQEAFYLNLWQDDCVDIILFTSQQSMLNLFILLGKKASTWIRKKPCLVISKRLAQIATSLGIETIIISPLSELIPQLDYFKKGLLHE